MNMTHKTAGIVSLALLIFYIAIIMYVLFGVVDIAYSADLMNIVTGLIFEFIGFAVLAFMFVWNFLFRTVKLGYYVPILVITFIYTILLDVLNLAGICVIAGSLFLLLHLVLLFVYCLIAAPMYVMGRK